MVTIWGKRSPVSFARSRALTWEGPGEREKLCRGISTSANGKQTVHSEEMVGSNDTIAKEAKSVMNAVDHSNAKMLE